MTLEEKKYIKRQLNIIQNKIDEELLNRYSVLLSVANISKEVRDFLDRAVDMRRKELNPISPMAVNGDLDDIN